MLGFTVSFIMLTGAAPATFAGQLADRYGHLRVVMAGSAMFTLGAILQGAASALPMLLVGRALAGFGEGLWLSNVSVYVYNTFPPRLLSSVSCLGWFYKTSRLPRLVY